MEDKWFELLALDKQHKDADHARTARHHTIVRETVDYLKESQLLATMDWKLELTRGFSIILTADPSQLSDVFFALLQAVYQISLGDHLTLQLRDNEVRITAFKVSLEVVRELKDYGITCIACDTTLLEEYVAEHIEYISKWQQVVVALNNLRRVAGTDE